jgi:hypothetical protein
MTLKYRNIKVDLYLEGVSPLLEEDVSRVGSRQRICVKLSIISFLCCVRDSSSNILKGPLVPSYLFSPTMRGRFGVRDIFYSIETISRRNSLYPDLIGDMH